MCTTYLAAKLCRLLNVTKNPRLIRLNPNIPYKTRGNGAVAFSTDDGAQKTILAYVKKYSRVEDERTNPGVVFLKDEEKATRLHPFYRRTVSELVTIEEAEEVASKVGAECHKLKNGRGIIGALAAIGFTGDKTYEIISYRQEENWGTPRKIDDASIHEMDRLLYPKVFDNIGPDGKRILITPRGYDPILCGIRGTSLAAVEAAWRIVKPKEPVEFTQVFETNQATDAHLVKKKISAIKPYDCVIVSGKLSAKPKIISGGHIIFSITDATGEIDCAVYKKSGTLRDIAAALTMDDEIKAYGGISRHPKTINLEKIEVMALCQEKTTTKPKCCSKTMTSAGREKGYKCKKCGKKVSHGEVMVCPGDRSIKLGLYDVPPGSRRHLSRPVFLMSKGGY